MRTYTKRVQIMFTESQYDLLVAHARKVSKPLSTLIREVVEQSLLTEMEQPRKEEALARLCPGDAPVSDCLEMEREMEGMWQGHGHDEA